jgi:hypothetical protein
MDARSAQQRIIHTNPVHRRSWADRRDSGTSSATKRESCKNARNIDPTPKVSQRIDLVAKDWNWWGHLSLPTVTLPQEVDSHE